MKCPNCKKMIQSSDKFCWHCGCPITQNDGRPKWIVPSVIFGSVVLASAIYFGANYFGPQSFQQSAINPSVASTSVSTRAVSALPVPTLSPIPSPTTIPPTPTNIPVPTPSPTAVPAPTSNPNTIPQFISYVDDKDKSLWIWDPQTDKSTKYANEIATYQWSPTGDKIAYIGEKGLSVTDLKSKEAILSSVGDSAYTWSLDGIQLVFSEGCKVYLIDSNGANKRLLYDLNEEPRAGGGAGIQDEIDLYLRRYQQHFIRSGPIAYWSDDRTRIAIILRPAQCRNQALSINANGSSAKTCEHVFGCQALLPKSSTIDPYLGYSLSFPAIIKNESDALYPYKYYGLSLSEQYVDPSNENWVTDVEKRKKVLTNWGFHNNIWITTTIGTEKRITSQPTFKNQGMISKDGKWIVFTETTVKNGRLDSGFGAFNADLTVNIIAMNIETGFTKKINAQSNAVNPAWQFPARSIK